MNSSDYVVYRAKQAILSKMFSEDTITIQKLPQFMTDFLRLNSGTVTKVQCDDIRLFRRSIMVLNPK